VTRAGRIHSYILLRGGRDGRTAIAANGKGRHCQAPMAGDIANLAIVRLEMYIPSMDRRFYLPEKGVTWKA